MYYIHLDPCLWQSFAINSSPIGQDSSNCLSKLSKDDRSYSGAQFINSQLTSESISVGLEGYAKFRLVTKVIMSRFITTCLTFIKTFLFSLLAVIIQFVSQDEKIQLSSQFMVIARFSLNERRKNWKDDVKENYFPDKVLSRLCCSYMKVGMRTLEVDQSYQE